MAGHVRAGSEGWTFPSWEAGHPDALQRASSQATTGDSEGDPRELLHTFARRTHQGILEAQPLIASRRNKLLSCSRAMHMHGFWSGHVFLWY